MAVDEHSRHALYTRLQQVLGEEHAVTLMAHLPPAGSDVATRQGVDAGFAALEPRFEAIDRRFDAVDERIDLRTSETTASITALVHAEIAGVRAELHGEVGALRREMVTQTRTLVFAMIGAMTTVAALAFAAARLAVP